MRLTVPLGPLLLALSSTVAVPALAQSDYCNQVVNNLCAGLFMSDCFASDADWAVLPALCIGDVQTMIEMEREAFEQGNGDAGGDGMADGNYDGSAYGQSFAGGVLRNGPGTGYGRIGSVGANDFIEIYGGTGDWLDGYQWFAVNWNGVEGYFWGALFCVSSGEYLEGSNGAC